MVKRKPVVQNPQSGDRQQKTRSLEKEIAMLETVMNQAFDLALGIQDPNELARVMSAISLTAMRVEKLFKAERLKEGSLEEEIDRAIDQAIAELVEELGLEI